MDSQAKLHCLAISCTVLLSILAVWLPFVAENREAVLFRYWDGPSYVTVAYSLYSLQNPVYAAYGFGPEFYAAHFPAYPTAIRLLSFIGYFNAMLAATALFAVLAVIAFYFLAKEFMKPNEALLLSLVFVFFPARWLVYHSVGASESLFLFAAISSLYFFRKNNFAAAAGFGALAALTRAAGVLLFPAFLAALWLQRRKAREDPAVLCWIPTALLALFTFHLFQFGDFFAAFEVNAGYAKGFLSAFAEFGGHPSGELTALLFGLYAVGTARLWQRRRFDLFAVSLAFFVPVLFIAHSDVSRYLLPAAPFALLLGFDDVLAPLFRRKSFWLAFALFAAAALFYAWSTLPTNLMPEKAFARLAGIVG
ncbi:MAG: hypothetical protein AB1626_00475 [Candidatus Micrarchaeota archaeon]